MTAFAVVIPAFNEAAQIAEVVRVALAATPDVLVVDDGSSDATAAVAQAAGAEVLRLPENQGKGGALFAAAAHLPHEVVVLLDADLTGLEPAHVSALAAPVCAGACVMTRGVFAGGRWRTTLAQRLTPQINGQRGILRAKLLQVENLRASRYGVEIAITKQAARAAWPWQEVPLRGVSQVMKEEKRGYWRGVRQRLRMYQEIGLELLRGKP